MVRYADSIIAIAKSHNDKLTEGRALYTQSMAVYKQGNELGALELAKKASALTNPTDSVTYIKSSTMMAYMLQRHDEEVKALNIAFRALKNAESHGWRRLAADCRICIADIYRVIDRPGQALPYAQQAAKDMLAVRDTGMYIFALSTLSNIYSQRGFINPGNLSKAVDYMQVILNKPYVSNISLFERARYMSNLGRLYEMQHKLLKAEEVLKQCIALCQTYGFFTLEKPALNELATIKNDQHRYNEAIAYAKQALDLKPGQQISSVLRRNIYNRLNDAYLGLNDFKNAYKYSELYHEINDSIMELARGNAATELNEKYILDKRLLSEEGKAKLAKQQRNFAISLAIVIVFALVVLYWLVSTRRKKEAALLSREHKQLAKLDAMKSHFFSNISHELRTPLTLIMGPLDMLVNQDIQNETLRKQHLETVWRNSRKLLGMVNELLDLGKIEAGKLPVREQQFRLLSFIRVLYEGFASAAEHKHVRYSVIYDIDEKLTVSIDKEKLEKIINNLIGNAIKFTPERGSIYINAEADQSTFYFSISNTGSGVHPDDLPYIFDRYYQGSKYLAEGGSGVGLAITREFTTILGGEIKVDSDWGKGVTFSLQIPVKTVSQETDCDEITDNDTLHHGVKGAHNKNRNTILVVEDHAEMAAYIGTVLNGDYNVISAGNGSEALQRLHRMQNLPDLIISDVMMPLMDGFTLLEHLKAHEQYHTIPVIMLTALADGQNRTRALNIGVDDYITKPFVSSELLARVGGLLANASEREITGEEEESAEHESGEAEITMVKTSPADLLWLSEVEKLVRDKVGKKEINLATLSYELAVSERQLHRRIKSITGLTPNKYIRAIRLQVAREALESGRYRTVAEISYAAGFDTPAYFARLFKEHYGRDVNEML